MIARFLLNYRYSRSAILWALLAGPLCLAAKAQVVQPQSGSSGQQAQSQAQPQPAQNPPSQDQKQPAKNNQTTGKQKKIKAHVVKMDNKKKPAAQQDTSQSAEPDKVLYQRALGNIKKGRYTEGRLSLQALINTYPDSEYLAKAKLSVADSYYKEGGTSNLTQAIDEYKNFIIFFPFLTDDAAYAQMQIGMGHMRMMEKADRDTTQAIEAEQEFQTFLLKYPQSPLVPKAEQNLRNVQEVLADGEFKIGRFYFVKGDFPASAARLIEVSERYPLYSQSDQTLLMLGEVYDRAKRVSRNEDDKNHWADLAGRCYSRIAENYPLSHLAPVAKTRLKAMGMPVPQPDSHAVARMKTEQLYQKEHHQSAVIRFPMGMLKSGPPLDQAAHGGAPNLNPPNDAVSARDVLLQGAKGPDFELASRPPSDSGQGPSEDTTPVDASSVPKSTAPAGTNVGVQIITPPDDQPAAQTPAATQPSTNSASGANPSSTQSTNVSDISASPINTPPEPPAPSNTVTPTSVQGGTASPPPAVQGAAGTAAPASTNASGTAQSGSSTASGQSQTPQADDQKPAKADKADPSTESTSKKKKGIKKVIPW